MYYVSVINMGVTWYMVRTTWTSQIGRADTFDTWDKALGRAKQFMNKSLYKKAEILKRL